METSLVKYTIYKLPVHGQATIVYTPQNINIPVQFTIRNKDNNNVIHFTHGKNIEIQIHYSFKTDVDNFTFGEPLITDNNAFYWFSIDSQNQLYMGGIGEARLETKQYKITENSLLANTIKKSMETLQIIDNISNIQKISIYKNPVVDSVPLIVKKTNQLTMDDIAQNKFLPHSFLNTTCQQLFDCVSGTKFILDDDTFPHFTKAIQYSIDTPGCWCNTKLKDKSTEFNPNQPNIKETYLRITLGQNNGESPGIPYVMEIWPSGHYSPIHSHANASAIIRVLHGTINVKLYPFLASKINDIKDFAVANFNKNDVTWITPQLNQTHQLTNIDTNTACITIQCYMYDSDNYKHYDYFDYIDTSGNIVQYDPDSDMDFVNFKKLMKSEWNNRPKNCLMRLFK